MQLEKGPSIHPLTSEYIALLKDALNGIKANTMSGTLRPANGAGYGFIRWVSEWGTLKLFNAVAEVESFFLDNN
ncbi:MAG: hypothetical protein EBS05_22585 [Proteobacteria bacterium]|nr:hypothetical protein [Pseudomonadota bacterium]